MPVIYLWAERKYRWLQCFSGDVICRQTTLFTEHHHQGAVKQVYATKQLSNICFYIDRWGKNKFHTNRFRTLSVMIVGENE